MTDETLKKWLESRFSKIEQRIGELEQSISESKQPRMRIAWYRTLLGMTELGGKAGTEKLADHIGVSRSVISEYLNRMEEEGIVKRDFNEIQVTVHATYGKLTGTFFLPKLRHDSGKNDC